jgi:enoyl-[acyl-carrier-protein] reductase (NADH)
MAATTLKGKNAVVAGGAKNLGGLISRSIAYHKSQSMSGRLTRIEDIAPIVRFLVTEGSWITGQTLFANGGYTTR